VISCGVEYRGNDKALLKGVAVDAQDDESSREEGVRKFKVTDIGVFREGHGERDDDDGEGARAPSR
jgi:hypothetical protein